MDIRINLVRVSPETRETINEIFYTSLYSPEINPDEYLNHNLKMDVHSGVLPHTDEDLLRKTHSFMKRLQKDKSKVQDLFKHKNLSYITKQAA